MSNDKAITRFEIAKLDLHAGDTVVVKTDLMLTAEQAKKLRESVEACVPNTIKVMVLSAGITLEVLRDADPPS